MTIVMSPSSGHSDTASDAAISIPVSRSISARGVSPGLPRLCNINETRKAASTTKDTTRRVELAPERVPPRHVTTLLIVPSLYLSGYARRGLQPDTEPVQCPNNGPEYSSFT